jgi:hypothetical protein
MPKKKNPAPIHVRVDGELSTVIGSKRSCYRIKLEAGATVDGMATTVLPL